MATKEQEPYHYKACGLDNVYLVNGFYMEETDYGPVISFEDIEGLHALIAHRLVNHDRELSGKEFRFLRKELEFSQKEVARLFGYDEQTIGRWERGENDMPGSADRLIRLLYQEYYTKNPHVRELLEKIAALVQEEEQMKLTASNLCFQRDSDEWKLAA